MRFVSGVSGDPRWTLCSLTLSSSPFLYRWFAGVARLAPGSVRRPYDAVSVWAKELPSSRSVVAICKDGLQLGGGVAALLRDCGVPARLAHFKRPALRDCLITSGVSYLFLGLELGGRPKGGCVPDYELMAASPPFADAIAQVERIAERTRLGLMCSEHEPLTCHRCCLLVGRHLVERGVGVAHILRDGTIEPNRITEDPLLALTRRTDADLTASRADREPTCDRRVEPTDRGRASFHSGFAIHQSLERSESRLFRRRDHGESNDRLTRIRNSFVIARNTAFTFKGKNVDAKEIGKELGVRYVLEGSVQRDQSRVRVNAQLIDAESGAHLWAERFEEDIADLFKLQDQVGRAIGQ
jgi:hypothetical protein